MSRPSRKDIRAAIDKLRAKPEQAGGGTNDQTADASKPPAQKSSQRIRKKGI